MSKYRSLSLCLMLLMLVVAACDTPAEPRVTDASSTTVTERPERSRVTTPAPTGLDPCSLLGVDEVGRVLERPSNGVFAIVGDASAQCTWTTDTGGFQETELVVQVAESSESASLLADLDVLRGVMEVTDDDAGLGDASFGARWASTGSAYVAVSDTRLVLVATERAGADEELRDMTERAISRLP